MKYLTGVEATISGALIYMKCYMRREVRFAFNYPEYNYNPPSSTSDPGGTLLKRFSRFSQPVEAARIVHNLCINWQ